MNLLLPKAGMLALVLAGSPLAVTEEAPGEWQLTYSTINHLLDNNDNFSRDDRFSVSTRARPSAAESVTPPASGRSRSPRVWRT